jgi:hypothetical protein
VGGHAVEESLCGLPEHNLVIHLQHNLRG